MVLELLKATLLSTSTRATRLFCDVYNPQSKTYCKRLQVLCPEHSRDPKVRFFLKLPTYCPTLLHASHPFVLFLPSLFSLSVSSVPSLYCLAISRSYPFVSFTLSFRFSAPPQLITPTPGVSAGAS